jgi:uncharacterized damage-inducible protein DinB
MTEEDKPGAQERKDLLETLKTHRAFLRHTVRDLTDEQARERTTVSQLCLGGVLKHVAEVESRWAGFIDEGASAMGPFDDSSIERHQAGFRMEENETLAGILQGYEEVASRTDHLLSSINSLDDSRPLPEAPWFKPGARWTARRVVLHIIAETAQHAGHADILRESLDGAKTMG